MPKVVDHDQYRRELLGKCFDLFAAKGYGAVTMRQIAQGLDVSTGTLYHYFPNKEALFCQLIEEQTQRDILVFLAEAGAAQSLPERIKALINFVVKNIDYFSKQMLLWMDFWQQQEQIERQGHESLKRSDRQVRQALIDYLQIQETAIADLILNFLNGLILDYIFDKQNITTCAQQGGITDKNADRLFATVIG